MAAGHAEQLAEPENIQKDQKCIDYKPCSRPSLHPANRASEVVHNQSWICASRRTPRRLFMDHVDAGTVDGTKAMPGSVVPCILVYPSIPN